MGSSIAAHLLKPFGGLGAPLRQQSFRRIWTASLFSNLGQQVQAVGAAWAMVQLTSAPDMVALVQTASMAPIMVLALAAGAIADMYDRRKVALAALSLALLGAATLAVCTALGLITPMLLLGCCFTVGSGIALYSPAWQASASEMVGREATPAAIALYSISNNGARSVGPAVGGIIVATLGTTLAFGINALLYLPLIITLFLWNRKHEPPRLPPERIDRAIVSGVRYVTHAPPIRRVLARSAIVALGIAAVYAMMPLVAHTLLGGGAATYGLLLGSFGAGAVTAGLSVTLIRSRMSAETATRLFAVCLGIACLVISLSRWAPLSAAALFVAGGSWLANISTYNIGVQLSTPRWVAGRALATFQAVTAGGIAIGAWAWGHAATAYGVPSAMLAAGLFILASQLLSLWLKMPESEGSAGETVPSRMGFDLKLDLNGRSGPIVLEVEYRVDPAEAREFYHQVRRLQRTRERNGAYGVSILRDISEPWIWIERFHYPTWHDYLRSRERHTVPDLALADLVYSFHKGDTPPGVRRRLERPFGSVRWKDDAPDHSGDEALPLPTT